MIFSTQSFTELFPISMPLPNILVCIFPLVEHTMGCRYMCYYCTKSSDETDVILEHELLHHRGDNQNFSLRVSSLNDTTGQLYYQSQHYGIALKVIHEKRLQGVKVIVDTETIKIRFKRTGNQSDVESEDTIDDLLITSAPSDSNSLEEQLHRVLPDVLHALEETGRGEDFVSVLKSIASGKLNVRNISLNLLLDLGQYLNQSSSTQMRYSKATLDFWVVVQKLFKGEGIGFFSMKRLKSDESEKADYTDYASQHLINFCVPSKNILNRESNKFRISAENPGIISDALDTFATSKRKGTSCKISIDGKKLAYGFGKKLGDEDIGGFEPKPTLKDRTERLDNELSSIKSVVDSLNTLNDSDLSQLDSAVKSTLATNIKAVINTLSVRCRELREVVSKKKTYVQNLINKANELWQTSKLATAISYIKTQIIKSNACISRILHCIDQLGAHVAALNGTHLYYKPGIGIEVDLDRQGNYICLRDLDENTIKAAPNTASISSVVKQKSKEWHSLRNEAVITGSTIHKALGIGSLKGQTNHYDTVFRGVEEKPTPELQQLFHHGTTNEVNALATFVSKIMPVYYPDLLFKEDGCIVLDMKSNTGAYAVISGDGTGQNMDNTNILAVEFKCPMPNKQHVPDVYYRLPPYYVTQVLSQMAAKECEMFVNLCYTQESSTYIVGGYDKSLWCEVWELATKLYGHGPSRRPTVRCPESKVLEQSVKTFSDKCTFIAEFPSVKGITCKCTTKAQQPSDAFHRHHTPMPAQHGTYSVETCHVAMLSAKDEVQEAYQLLRKPAKEILLGVISDLDRTVDPIQPDLPNAMPFLYYMVGASLKMDTVRLLLQHAALEVESRDLHLQVKAFDGQFLDVAIKDFEGKPVTLCKLDKEVWEKAKKVSKDDQIKHLSNLNACGPISSEEELNVNFDINKNTNGSLSIRRKSSVPVFSPCNVGSYITTTTPLPLSGASSETLDDLGQPEDCILQFLPEDIIASLDEEALQVVRQVGSAIQEKRQNEQQRDPEILNQDIGTVTDELDSTVPSHALLASLTSMVGSAARKAKWEKTTIVDLENYLCDATEINRNFTVNELRLILSQTKTEYKQSHKKAVLVNMVSTLYGDGSSISQYNSVKSLRQLAIMKLKKLLYAVNIWPDAMVNYEESAYFKSHQPWTIETDDFSFQIPQWYSQPIMFNNHPLQIILDPHHIYVNNRVRCCTTGMPGMGIKQQAWLRVTEQEQTRDADKKTGLSLELVVELRDKQRNAFAATTFSEKVELAMTENGHIQEAKWCRLLRNWYAANDEAGVSVTQRITWMLDMRSFLLQFYTPGSFPPPGWHVAGLPMAQFEGLLTNMERRLQLFHLAGPYNQRSVSSLDSETMFGSFQVSKCVINKHDTHRVLMGYINNTRISGGGERKPILNPQVRERMTNVYDIRYRTFFSNSNMILFWINICFSLFFNFCDRALFYEISVPTQVVLNVFPLSTTRFLDIFHGAH